MREADYVIVGSGSAGSALAYRLSENGRHSVIVVEFGGTDIGPLIQMPAALSFPMNMSLYDWGFRSEPEPHLGGRVLATPRGKVLGGSSSINGMAYVRGNALDYENWAEMGARGWSYAEVLPYFRKAETRADGGDAYRGDKGPLHTSNGTLKNPLYRAFIEAGVQAGYGATDDMNGYRQEGFGRMDMTVHRGQRWSCANAYIHPIRNRPNLKIALEAFVDRVTVAGNRAGGVAYTQGDQSIHAKAEREVILSGGSINSPQLLLLSGIGPGAQLQQHGIAVVKDLPGVGENLMDHLELYQQMECTQPISLYSALNPVSKALIGARWTFFKDGLGATNHFEAGAFFRSRPGVRWADIQYHFLPAAMRYDGKAAFNNHGFQVHVGPMRSKSRGFVRIRSKDPRESPRILFNYLSHPDDLVEWRSCTRLTREIMAQPAMERYAGAEIQPGKDVETDDQIDAFIREHCESAYHPCGTCKMGSPQDPMAVVDSECRVIGIANLRVADSSIMPQVTNGNLNAPTLMIGEKASDHILGRDPLPPSNQEPWINPDWAVSQR